MCPCTLLSSDGMKRVSEYDKRKFTFIVGDHKYECCVSQACFLSSRVSWLLCSDSSVDSFVLDFDDPDGYFGEVLKLGSGQSVHVDDRHCELVRQIGSSLGNDELCLVYK